MQSTATRITVCLVYRENTRQQHVFGWVLDKLVIGFEVGTTSIDVGKDSPIGLCKWVAGVGVPSVVEHVIVIFVKHWTS